MFITFEGIDGSGKTTQIQLLKDALEQEGYTVICLREPGGTALSEHIRSLLLDSDVAIVPEAETLLFNAARAQLVRTVIQPALDEGAIVLCDRFFDSTTAYQAYGRGLSKEGVDAINLFATGSCVPDLTILIDISPEAARKRAQERDNGNADRMERNSDDFFSKVYTGFKHIASEHSSRVKVIAGENTKSEIHSSILSNVRSVL